MKRTIAVILSLGCIGFSNSAMLRVTTTVRLHNTRGRLYFAPVRLAHPIVMRAMLRSAARSWRASV